MQKRVLYLLAALVAGSVLANAVSAKVWLLPDYQQKQFYSNRANSPGSNQNSPNDGSTGSVDCSKYGMVSASQLDAGMVCQNSARIKDTICYGNCSCPSEYQYTSSNCPASEGKTLAGRACNGEYTECKCDSGKYPYSSANCNNNLEGDRCYDGTDHYALCTNPCDNPDAVDTGSCQYGCETPVNGCSTKCLKCSENSCNNADISSLPDVSECGYKCKTTAVGCSTKCQECYHDSCDWPENQNLVNKGDCDYGCAGNATVNGCPSKCARGCQTCVPCGEGYVASCPANMLCSEPCSDCDGAAKVKPIGCAIGYGDYNTYWCGMAPATTDCAALGYETGLAGAALCTMGRRKVYCPFDPEYSTCVGQVKIINAIKPGL